MALGWVTPHRSNGVIFRWSTGHRDPDAGGQRGPRDGGFLVFFRFMVMALSDYFEERLHLLTRGTLDDFNARGSVLMMQDHKHISGKDYRV